MYQFHENVHQSNVSISVSAVVPCNSVEMLPAVARDPREIHTRVRSLLPEYRDFHTKSHKIMALIFKRSQFFFLVTVVWSACVSGDGTCDVTRGCGT